jgi:hypothetical protein
VHGSYREGPVTDQAIDAILQVVTTMAPAELQVVLDSPVAFSGRMAQRLRRLLAGLESEVLVVPSADTVLRSCRGAVASSDTVVLDTASRIVDLPRMVLRGRFGFDPPHVDRLLQR